MPSPGSDAAQASPPSDERCPGPAATAAPPRRSTRPERTGANNSLWPPRSARLPQFMQIRIDPLVPIERVVDIRFELVALLRDPRLQLRVAGEQLLPLLPNASGLAGVFHSPVCVPERDIGADVIAPYRAGFLHLDGLLQVGHAESCAIEHLRPVEIAVPACVIPDPTRLQLDGPGEVGDRIVGQHHLRERPGRWNPVHASE